MVGSEGLFGLISIILLQIPMYYCRTQTFQFGYNPTGRLVDPTGRGNNSQENISVSQSHCRRICSDEQQPQAVHHTADQSHHHRILKLW